MRSKMYLLAVLILFFMGCDTQTNRVKEKTRQQSFNDFLSSKNEMKYRQGNDIQKKEFLKQFEVDLSNYLDSIQLFVNWIGQIKDIKTEEYGQSTLLKFEIYYEPEKYREITFECSHIVKTVDLESDYLYNKVKNMSNYSTVYVDGFIKRKMDNSVSYYSDVLFTNHISYPHYKFNVVKINNELTADTLSNNLRKALDIDFEVMDLFKQEFQKKINQKERDERVKSLQFDSIQAVLLEDEKQYSQRIRQYLLNDFMYE
ncbi:hypothetical protein AGMMS4956_13810 [Bacteroidia bacterium]|nr:hypothetical protein AGMMS4956_13810 [Bacteroidia bacterium]